MKLPLVVAHRGDSKHAPENTLSSFVLAIEKGADAIEFDVQLTEDHELVVHHDSYLGRTNTGSGFIGDCTLAELRSLDAGSWFGPTFARERIPILQEVLELGRGKVRFEIELKGTSRALLKRVIEELTRYDVGDVVELTSPHIPLLIEVAKIEPTMRRGMFFGQRPEWMGMALAHQQILDYLSLSHIQVAHLPLSLLDDEFLSRLHAAGFLAHAANLNSESEIERGIMLNVDQFSTENIDLALAKRDQWAIEPRPKMT